MVVYPLNQLLCFLSVFSLCFSFVRLHRRIVIAFFIYIITGTDGGDRWCIRCGVCVAFGMFRSAGKWITSFVRSFLGKLGCIMSHHSRFRETSVDAVT